MVQSAEKWVRRHRRIRKIAGKITRFPAFLRRETNYKFIDFKEWLSGQKDDLVPPMRMRRLVGPENSYRDAGDEFLKIFIDIGGLKPNDRVLDVGCGMGRMARALATYLNKQGSYEGFDIVEKEIRWANRAFESRFPNFHFQLADMYNKEYNPKGRFKASEYRFPYYDNSFDFVFLTSVFTHMLPEDMENYFAEISRVLKSQGRCLISCFLLNENSLKQIGTKDSLMNFQYEIDGYRTVNKERPEAAIAYFEKTMLGYFNRNKLKVDGPIHYGSWCKSKSPLTFQDVVVSIKQ